MTVPAAFHTSVAVVLEQDQVSSSGLWIHRSINIERGSAQIERRGIDTCEAGELLQLVGGGGHPTGSFPFSCHPLLMMMFQTPNPTDFLALDVS